MSRTDGGPDKNLSARFDRWESLLLWMDEQGYAADWPMPEQRESLKEAARLLRDFKGENERLQTAVRLVLQGISDEMSACTESFTGQARYTGLLDAKQRIKRTFEVTT